MSRFIQYLNLLGVIALVALCCIQWRTNRRLNLQMIDLETTRLAQSTRIAEQDKTIAGDAADLNDLSQRLTLSESALKDAEDKYTTLMIERNKLAVERDQLKTALDKWIAAVAERDDALKKSTDQLQSMIDQRDDAVSKFNDLAEKYNAMVKQFPTSRTKQ